MITENTVAFPQRTRPFEHYAVEKTKFIDMGAKEKYGGVWIKDFKFDDKKYGDVEYNRQFKNWITALIAKDAGGRKEGKWRFWTQHWCTNPELRKSEKVQADCITIAQFDLCADGSGIPCV